MNHGSPPMMRVPAEVGPPEFSNERSIYVHVPFCAHTCDFCAFYQVQPRADDIQRYLRGVERELALVEFPGKVDTVFWGGGTPGLLLARDLQALGERVLGACGGTPAEWTVEIAPGSARAEKLRALRGLGVTRISMGVQSFNPRLLDALGRQHSLEQVRTAIDLVRAEGFPDFNIDLIFGIPGQSLAEWEADLREAVRLNPDHISTYCLTFEEDTALYLRLMQGKHRIDRENEARFYEVSHQVLTESGYCHYEVSNFARPGHLCRHNLVTWRMGWWAGIGPSAASQQTSWRGGNPPDLERWLNLLNDGQRAGEDRANLDAAALALDRVVFGLRTSEGVPWQTLREAFEPEARSRVEALVSGLVQDGRATLAQGVLALTPEGFLIADAVGSEIIEAVQADC